MDLAVGSVAGPHSEQQWFPSVLHLGFCVCWWEVGEQLGSRCIFLQVSCVKLRCFSSRGEGGGVFFHRFYSGHWPRVCLSVNSCLGDVYWHWEILNRGGGRMEREMQSSSAAQLQQLVTDPRLPILGLFEEDVTLLVCRCQQSWEASCPSSGRDSEALAARRCLATTTTTLCTWRQTHAVTLRLWSALVVAIVTLWLDLLFGN